AAWASAVERLLRRLAVPVAVVSIAALVWLLPPRGDVASSILLTSHRLTLLLRFMPRSRVPQLADELAVIDVREPYRAPAPEKPAWTIPADWNVVLVVIDALRADAVPPTLDDRPKPRFTRSDAPFLAALSERSFRFRRTYTPATYTYMAMPAMFLSQPPLQSRPGAPLGALMDESGRMSFAVVNDFFAQPIDEHLTQLQAGFAEVRTYSESAQNEQRPLIDALLDEFHAQPFFAWLHYYAVHSPGWDGKAVPRMRAEWPENYRKCLRWVDGEIAWLFAKLEKLGIAERTVVVVTADHGEGLMDTGHMYHGPYVYEEAVRVPLLIYVPGKQGRLVEETVGTIDIAPTLVQLVGGRRRSSHAGRSLLPLMFDGRDAPDLPYFFVSGSQQQAGLVQGSDKHIYDRPSGAQLHFDLDHDPLEDSNNYDVRKHQPVVQLMVQNLPELFAGDLDSARTQTLLDRRLREADGRKLPAQLRLLLRTIRLSPTPGRIAWVRRAFERADSDDARLALVGEIGPENLPALATALRRRLEASRDPDQEALFVDGLADLGVPPFEREFVTQRFSAALAGPRARWLPWLRLTAAWPRASADEIRPLAALAERFANAQTDRDEVALRMLLAALAMADLRATAHASIAAALERWLAEPRAALRSDAARALGRTEPKRAARLLRPMLEDGSLMVRLAALEGLTSALGTRVFPHLERMMRDTAAHATVLRLAAALGTERGQALLRTLASDAKNQFVRANARRALTALERPEDAGDAASAIPEH
ncbi:MAG TPA: sulfatase-like hydrolase/transferase, partial [Polyangiales bacterium]|nr:sulfatase-like hydrolase/transferase [Polyangiales bacterium]